MVCGINCLIPLLSLRYIPHKSSVKEIMLGSSKCFFRAIHLPHHDHSKYVSPDRSFAKRKIYKFLKVQKSQTDRKFASGLWALRWYRLIRIYSESLKKKRIRVGLTLVPKDAFQTLWTDFILKNLYIFATSWFYELSVRLFEHVFLIKIDSKR